MATKVFEVMVMAVLTFVSAIGIYANTEVDRRTGFTIAGQVFYAVIFVLCLYIWTCF